MNLRQVLITLLTLVIAVAFAGCGGGASTRTSDGLSAQQIAERMLASFENIKTFRMDMTLEIEGGFEEQGETVEGGTISNWSGTIDLESNEMKMFMSILFFEEGEALGVIESETYLLGNTMYTKIGEPGEPEQWFKLEIPEEFLEKTWDSLSQIQSQSELLEGAQVELLPEEKVNSLDSHVLQVTPDIEEFWAVMTQSSGSPQQESLLQLLASTGVDTEELLRAMTRDMTMKQWIAKDTYFPMKAEMQMSVSMTESTPPITMDYTLELLFHDYNQPLSIELPPEAESATEIPSPAP